MNVLLSVVQQLANFIIGPFGISMIGLGVGGCFIAAMVNMMPVTVAYRAMYCGAGAYSAAWFASLMGQGA